MTNGTVEEFKGLANLLDQVADDCWKASRMNPQARTCEYVAKEIRALIAKVESLAADAERLDQLEKIIGRNDCGPHIYSHGRCYEGETMREVLDLVIEKEKA